MSEPRAFIGGHTPPRSATIAGILNSQQFLTALLPVLAAM
jgi:hypothetical protein